MGLILQKIAFRLKKGVSERIWRFGKQNFVVCEHAVRKGSFIYSRRRLAK